MTSDAASASPDLALSATTTLAEAVRIMVHAFTRAGIDTPDLDARFLLCPTLAIDAGTLITEPDRQLGARAPELVARSRRRIAREPVSRILGVREFYGRSFEVTPATLDPRPDSETLIDAVLDYVRVNGGRERPWRILDVGTGSGCLLITLLAELPNASGVATDISQDALEVAARNAVLNGVSERATCIWADGLAALAPSFDILVSNPPYIPTADVAGLAPEVRDHDPRLALDGGADGLSMYRQIGPHIAHLVPDGFVALEIGHDQATGVQGLLDARAAGWPLPVVLRDLNGNSRCVTLVTHR